MCLWGGWGQLRGWDVWMCLWKVGGTGALGCSRSIQIFEIMRRQHTMNHSGNQSVIITSHGNKRCALLRALFRFKFTMGHLVIRKTPNSMSCHFILPSPSGVFSRYHLVVFEGGWSVAGHPKSTCVESDLKSQPFPD